MSGMDMEEENLVLEAIVNECNGALQTLEGGPSKHEEKRRTKDRQLERSTTQVARLLGVLEQTRSSPSRRRASMLSPAAEERLINRGEAGTAVKRYGIEPKEADTSRKERIRIEFEARLERAGLRNSQANAENENANAQHRRKKSSLGTNVSDDDFFDAKSRSTSLSSSASALRSPSKAIVSPQAKDDNPAEEPAKAISNEIKLEEERKADPDSFTSMLLNDPSSDNKGKTRRRASTISSSRGFVAKQPPSQQGKLLSEGIRLAISEDARQPVREIVNTDFTQQIEHKPFLELAPGKGIQFDFVDWRPVVFRMLREFAGISYEEYHDSMCSRSLLGGGKGSGKSGASFFYSHDRKHVIKEVRKSERDVLLRMLPSYFNYVKNNPYSFLPKLLGLYTMNGMTVVVMSNVLHGPNGDEIFEVYDLKGSVQNRYTNIGNDHTPQQQSSTPVLMRSCSSPGTDATPPQKENSLRSKVRHSSISSEPTKNYSTPVSAGRMSRSGTPNVLKDLNLSSKFKIGPSRKRLVLAQLYRDVKFLEKHNIMDYSILLGVCEESDGRTTPGLATHASYDGGESTERTANSSMDCSPFHADGTPVSRDRSISLFTHFGANSSPISPATTPGEPSSELGAVFRRVYDKKRESAALLPEGSIVNIQLVGHGQAKRSRGSATIFRQSCTLYTWCVTRSDSNGIQLNWVVFRRYKDFENLHKGLQEELGSAQSLLQLPALPKKQRLGFMEPEFIRQREQELHGWLVNLLQLLDFRAGDSPALREFLTNKANRCPQGWRTSEDAISSIANSHSSILAALEGVPMSPSSPSTPIETLSPLAESTPTKFLRLDLNGKEAVFLWESALGGSHHRGFDAKRVVAGRPESNVRLYVGIIDILQEYNFSKKLESAYKGLAYNADSISAVDPASYSERFLSFMDEMVFR